MISREKTERYDKHDQVLAWQLPAAMTKPNWAELAMASACEPHLIMTYSSSRLKHSIRMPLATALAQVSHST